jgi:hypothetical protein
MDPVRENVFILQPALMREIGHACEKLKNAFEDVVSDIG